MTTVRRTSQGALAVAMILVAALMATSRGYGWFRDELYFRSLARHPAIAYPDVPFLTPFVARITSALGGASITAFRIWPALCMAGVTLLAGSMFSMFGGDRRATTVAAAAVATSPLALIFGHVFHYAAFDQLAWSAIMWLVVRLVVNQQPKLWIGVGLIGGLAYENKNLVVLLLIGLTIAFMSVGPRSALRSRWVGVGLVVAAGLAIPNVWWQATHGWPELALAQHIRSSGGFAQRLLVIPTQFALVGIPIVGLAFRGAQRLWRNLELRFLPVSFVAVLALLIVLGGKPYYASGLLPVFVAAGASETSALSARRVRLTLIIGLNAAIGALIALPIIPASLLGSTPVPAVYKDSMESIGWPEVVRQVTSVVDLLPPIDSERAIILTRNYGEAAAMELLSRSHPPVYSSHNAYFLWGSPPETPSMGTDVAIAIGIDQTQLRRIYDDVVPAARIDNKFGLHNEEQGHQIFICRGRHIPWRSVWPTMKNYS